MTPVIHLPKGTQLDNKQDANGIFRARLATGNGASVDADMTSRDAQSWSECTRDPIFLVQKRRVIGLDLVNGLDATDYYSTDGTLYIDAARFDVEDILTAAKEDRVLLRRDDSEMGFDMGIACSDTELIDRDWALTAWDTMTIMRTRQEAETYARGQAHNIGELGEGCRVYCMPCTGELATILEHIDRRELVNFVTSEPFKDALRAWREANTKQGPQA